MFRRQPTPDTTRENDAFWMWRESVTARLVVIEENMKNISSAMSSMQKSLDQQHVTVTGVRQQLTRIFTIASVVGTLLYFFGERLVNVLWTVGRPPAP